MKFLSTLLSRRRNLLSALALSCAALQASAAPVPLVDISSVPLYGTQTAHPNVVVTLSVEYPTVGTAFPTSLGDYDYTGIKQYVGYFDPNECYVYNSGPEGYFSGAGPASSNHQCVDQFSGNFMNWLTMSAVDEFRYAMTGGNRDKDDAGASGATLRRANLPDGSLGVPQSFYNNDQNFPSRSFNPVKLKNLVPNAVAGAGSTVFAYNCKSQVYFGLGAVDSNGVLGPAGTCAAPDNGRGTFDVRIAVCGTTDLPVRKDLCKNYGTNSAPIYKPVGQAQLNADSVRFAAFGYLMDRTVKPGCSFNGWNRCRYGGVLRAPIRYLGENAYDRNLKPIANSTIEINSIDGTLNDDPDGTAALLGLGNGFRYSGFINYINKFGDDGVYKAADPVGEMYYEALRYYQHLGPTPQASDPSPDAALSPDTMGHFPVAAASEWKDPILSTCSKNYIINIADANTWDDSYVPGYNGSPANSPSFRPSSRAKQDLQPGIPAGTPLDAVEWTRKIGLLEDDGPTRVGLGVSVPSLLGIESKPTGTYSMGDVNNLNGVATYFAAGMAYWANTTDIRPDLVGTQTVQTISVDVDEKGSLPQDQRQLYLMGKYGSFTNTIDRLTDTVPNPYWAVDPLHPSNPAIRTNSEWESSVGSPLPAGYLLASTPDRLIDGLKKAFATINAPQGTIGGAALTSTNLIVAGAGAYIAKFTGKNWAGTVERHSISVDPSTLATTVSLLPVPSNWNAATALDLRCGTVLAPASTTCRDDSSDPNNRHIFTTVSDGGLGLKGIPFKWSDVSADVAYRDALRVPDPGVATLDDRGQERLNYLRGFRGDEADATLPTPLRGRDSALGDILNSAPLYVGAPSTSIPDDDYQQFFADHVNRLPAVYVGANDGMLHAFDGSINPDPASKGAAGGGSELFAFIPGFSKSDLPSLTTPGYQHKTFVDTTPKVQEVKIGTTGCANGACWRTVLVGANGNGAQGIFALDVTDPTAFGAGNVMFEFSDVDDPDFGTALSSPEIAKLMVPDGLGGLRARYFAVVTTYNNTRTDVNGRANGDNHKSSSTDNKGVLFFIPLDHSKAQAWGAPNNSTGNYYKFYFDPIDKTKPMGLGPVAMLPSKSGDRSAAAFYFGDLQGQMWRFNTTPPAIIAGTGPEVWWTASRTDPNPPNHGLPIFNATDKVGVPQPITERPEISNGPFGSTLLYFGTGQFLGQSDTHGPYQQQTQYAVVDTTYSLNSADPYSDSLKGGCCGGLQSGLGVSGTSGSVPSPSAETLTRLKLAERTTLIPATGDVVVMGPTFTYSGASALRGWFMDFPFNGERSINKPAVRGGLLTFDTLILAGDICGSSGGYIYQVDALTGLPLTSSGTAGFASTVGIPGPPQIVDLQSIAGIGRATGEQFSERRQTTLVAGSKGLIDTPHMGAPSRPGDSPIIYTTGAPIGRVSWREISNWNDKTGH